jgi:hypothetical protein
MKQIFGKSMVHEGAPYGNKNAAGKRNTIANAYMTQPRNVGGKHSATFTSTGEKGIQQRYYPSITKSSAARFSRLARKSIKRKTGSYLGRFRPDAVEITKKW